jgi:hypothetical protein
VGSPCVVAQAANASASHALFLRAAFRRDPEPDSRGLDETAVSRFHETGDSSRFVHLARFCEEKIFHASIEYPDAANRLK